MIYRIGTMNDMLNVEFDNDKAERVVCFYVDILDSEYGAYRDIDTDDGGYILYATKGTLAENLQALFDYTQYQAELVHVQDNVCSAIYILSNDYPIVIISDVSDAPPEILKEYERQLEELSKYY